MGSLRVKGGSRLVGEVQVHGAKNSSLPILSAALLNGGNSILHHCPNLSDVRIACDILTCLGCKVKRENGDIIVNSSSIVDCDIPECLMGEMRSSIVFLGAMLARTGRAKVNFPGGCEIGQRPIDLHLSALRQMGVQIKEEHGYIHCVTKGRMQGAAISLSFPSVGATENIILAACMAVGETVIHNAAAEPEIADLAAYLNACGAKIKGAGENVVYIQGVEELHDVEFTVMPDRIVAATYLCAAAATRGEVLMRGVNVSHLASITPLLEQAGCRVLLGDGTVYLKAPTRLNAFPLIRTMPYPGFPTDAQPIFMAAAAVAEGASIFVENIFENRYMHVGELVKMGANVDLEGKVAVVNGVEQLSGAAVKATDLRGGAAMVIAGLCANGVTTVAERHHIERGYEEIEKTLGRLGATIIKEDQNVIDGEKDEAGSQDA